MNAPFKRARLSAHSPASIQTKFTETGKSQLSTNAESSSSCMASFERRLPDLSCLPSPAKMEATALVALPLLQELESARDGVQRLTGRNTQVHLRKLD